MRTHAKPTTSGTWNRTGRQGGKPVYTHISGETVAYDCNHWVWRVRSHRRGFRHPHLRSGARRGGGQMRPGDRLAWKMIHERTCDWQGCQRDYDSSEEGDSIFCSDECREADQAAYDAGVR